MYKVRAPLRLGETWSIMSDTDLRRKGGKKELKRVLLCLAVLMLVLPTVSCLAVNLLKNPGFENPCPTDPLDPNYNWYCRWDTAIAGARTDALAHTGTWCWDLWKNGPPAPGSGWAGVAQNNVDIGAADRKVAYKTTIWVKVPSASPTTPVTIAVAQRYNVTNYRDNIDNVITTSDWVQVSTGATPLIPLAGTNGMTYIAIHGYLGDTVQFYADDAETIAAPLWQVKGTVRDAGTGNGVPGAVVAISDVPNAFANARLTTTTDGLGQYTLEVPDATWYVAAQAPYYIPKPTPDTTVVVAGADVTGVDFALTYRAPEKLVDLDVSGEPIGPISFLVNNGTLGGIFWQNGNAPMIDGVADVKAITFTGSESMLADIVAPAAITDNGSYTVATWIYNPSLVWEECYFSWAERGGPDGSCLQMNYGESPDWGAVTHWGWPDMGFGAGGPPAVGIWHHIAVTFDGATEKVYVDGSLADQEAKTLNIWPNEPFVLGRAFWNPDASGWDLPFTGAIASLAVYDDALLAEDVATLAFTPPPVFIMSKVSGKVTDAGTGAPLANAYVALSDSPNPFANPLKLARTDDTGYYELKIWDGTWYVAAKAPRYAVSEKSIVVSGADVPNVDFALTFVGPIKLIDLKSDALVPGSLTSWPNAGELGGTFDVGLGGTPVVEEVAGKQAVTFAGATLDTYMVASFNSPPEICGSGQWSAAFWAYNPTIEDGIETVIGWGQRGNDAQLCQIGYGQNADWSAGAHYGWFDIGFDCGAPTAAQWQLILLTYDGVEERVYTGGLVNSREEKTLNILPGQPFYLGCYHEVAGTRIEYYSGSLASVEVYDCALTQAEARAMAGVVTVASVKGLPGEPEVTVTAPITLAPRDSLGNRTNYFYIEDEDRTAGIRVESVLPHQANPGGGARVRGVLKTNAAGERYILTNVSEILFPGGIPSVLPLGMNTKAIQEDPKAVAELINVGGKVKDISLVGSFFDIVDGFYKDGEEVATKVVVIGDSKIGWLSEGDFVTVTGVVSEAGASRVVLYRNCLAPSPKLPPVTPYSWGTGFEFAEGYSVGTIFGQQNWALGGWNPRGVGDDAATIITSADGPVGGGTQAVKMVMTESSDAWGGAWWGNMFELYRTCPEIDNTKQMKYMIWKMKFHRDGGSAEYPAGSGEMHSNLWFNQLWYHPDNSGANYTRYWDAGDDPDSMKTYGLVYNETPRRFGDPGVPTIGGRYAEVVIFDDYINHERTMWYDGAVIVNQAGIPAWGDRFGDTMAYWYGSANPWIPGVFLGQPCYMDDVSLGWDYR